MRPLDVVRVALFDLRASKLRTLLTGLGVIIGVGSVTLLLSLGEGVRSQVTGTFEDLGSTRIVVTPGTGFGGPAAASTITLDDADAIAAVDGVAVSSPGLLLPQLVTGDGEPVRMSTTGTTPGWFVVAGEPFVAGAAFSDAGGAVLDESAVATLFPGSDPAAAVGREVRAGERTFRVTGVVPDPPTAGLFGGTGPRTGALYVPLAGLMADSGQTFVSQVQLRATSPERTEDVRLAVRDLLEARHGLRDVSVTSLVRILDRVNEALSVITGFLAALAGISLLVGGIGIMNIMLAVVAERTREIGIIRALGATRGAVVLQFLTEAVFISLLGGVIGLLVALLAARGIDAALDVPAIVSPGIVALALGVSTLIGVLFGVLPAWRAARLDPIRALRHD